MIPSPRLSDLSDTVAVLGAGFSRVAEVPTAAELSGFFLAFDRTPVEQFITASLKRFWSEVFGYAGGEVVPTFEDHFTLLDLAANAGHNLGHYYTPSRLRALRRISIHRVFQIIDEKFKFNDEIIRFLGGLQAGKGAIVSLNWDIVVEKHLRERMHELFTYSFPGHYLDGSNPGDHAFPVIKLHGSANWHYCDACHTTQFGDSAHGKNVLHCNTLLEERDVAILEGEQVAAEAIRKEHVPVPCGRCQNPKTTARVATFSYAKAFDFFPFHASWDAALRRLAAAKRWIFIGYSLPEADFAVKHLLKTAQLASRTGKEIIAVTRENDIPAVKDRAGTAIGRYEQIFGGSIAIGLGGFAKWVRDCVP